VASERVALCEMNVAPSHIKWQQAPAIVGHGSRRVYAPPRYSRRT
jgi:hypothetical protein